MPDTLELSPATTHEQITEYVDQIVADRDGDAGEITTDAQKLAADRDGELSESSADDKSGSDDTAKPDDKAKAKAADQEPQAQDWLDEDLKAEVAAYGIDEKELADFTSREELERALRFFDRTALDVGRKALAESKTGDEEEPQVDEKTGRVRGDDGKFVKAKAAGESKDGRYEVGLDRDFFDENLVGELERMRDHYESRLEALESRFAESSVKAEEERFDSFIDSIGLPKLFGKTGEETPEQLKRREDVLVASKAHQIGLRKFGREVELDESLVRRAARMVYPDEFAREDLKSKTRKIFKQHNSRLGGSPTRATDHEETPHEFARRRYKELQEAGG